MGKIKKLLVEAGLYSRLYDVQIEQAEMAVAELKKMEKIVEREGRTIKVETKSGEKLEAHPLLMVINQYHRTITQQLASLGLNRLKMQGDVQKASAMQSFMQEVGD